MRAFVVAASTTSGSQVLQLVENSARPNGELPSLVAGPGIRSSSASAAKPCPAAHLGGALCHRITALVLRQGLAVCKCFGHCQGWAVQQKGCSSDSAAGHHSAPCTPRHATPETAHSNFLACIRDGACRRAAAESVERRAALSEWAGLRYSADAHKHHLHRRRDRRRRPLVYLELPATAVDDTSHCRSSRPGTALASAPAACRAAAASRPANTRRASDPAGPIVLAQGKLKTTMAKQHGRGMPESELLAAAVHRMDQTLQPHILTSTVRLSAQCPRHSLQQNPQEETGIKQLG